VATWNDGSSVDAQVFTAAGVTVGAQIHIGTGAANSSPQLSALSNGGFVLTWQEFNQPTPAFFTSAVRAQVFDATGGAVGSAITVSATYYNDSSLRPQVNALSNGDFVVTWTVTADSEAALRQRIQESADLMEDLVGWQALASVGGA